MQKHYSYLNDWDFLKEIDSLVVQERFVKITLLDYRTEKELDSIEGEISDGSLTKDGSSAARCSCSLTCSVDGYSYDIYDIKSKYSINKKIFIEIGITNNTNKYPDIPTVWFPQGVMIITDFSISSNAGGAISIQLKFKDKMCLLDGTVGGMLPATTRFDILTEIVNGESVNKKIPVYQIIQEAVNHFGGEPITNILIEDVPDKAKRALKWSSATPLWILSREETSSSGEKVINYYAYRQDDLSSVGGGEWDGQCFRAGYDVGFVYEEFVYDKELTFNAGSTVVQLLDTIKKWLGNFEYFYDEYGIFHFREVKNYLNTAVSTYEWTKNFTDEDYIYNPVNTGITYDFTDNVNLISMSATPQYQNIKNDYIIIGKNKTSGGSTDVIYHFVIDEKPIINEEGYENILLYTDSSIGKFTLAYPQMLTEEEFNALDSGDLGQIYGVTLSNKVMETERNASSSQDFLLLLENLVSNDKNTGKIDTLIDNKNFYSYNPATDTTDVASKIQETINSTTSGISETALLQIIYYLIEQKSCSQVVGSENLKTYCEERIASALIANDIKDYYRAMLYAMNVNISEEYKQSYKKYVENTYLDYPNIKDKIFGESGIYNQFVSLTSGNYQMFYTNCMKMVSALRAQISQIDSYLLGTTRGMYKSSSDRYKNLKELEELLRDLKTITESMLTQGYSSLNVPTLTTPSDFVYNKIEESYGTETTLDFYSWNGVRKQWEAVDWTYYYSKDGGYHYIDFSDERLRGLIAESVGDNKPNMQCNSSWYQNKFKTYVDNHDLASEIPYVQADDLNTYIAQDWRTEIILQGLTSEKTGIAKSAYYSELLVNWPIIYNLKTQSYYSSANVTDDFYSGDQAMLNNEEGLSFTNESGDNVSVYDKTANRQRIYYKPNDESGETYQLVINTGYSDDTITGNYFFDMLDARTSKWGEYSVSNIGCRRLVVTNEDVNCLFSQPLPEFGFIFLDGKTAEEINIERELIKQNGCNQVIAVDSDVYNYFATGGTSNGAYDTLRYNLLTHINYQETINMSVRPIFYLSPNSLINVREGTTGIAGKFVSKTLNIPLKVGSNMTINATKAEEKI